MSYTYLFIIFLVIACHCCVLSLFVNEKWYSPGSVPYYGNAITCAYRDSPIGSGIYGCCILMTIFLLIFYFGNVFQEI
jgi:hypothetical protein